MSSCVTAVEHPRVRGETRLAPTQIMETEWPHFRSDEHVLETVPLAQASVVPYQPS